MTVVRRFLALVAAACLSAQAHAEALNQGYPRWTASSAKSGSSEIISDLNLECNGSGCARNTLRCVTFHAAATAGSTDIHSLTDQDKFPLGQLSFWVAASIMQERKDLLDSQTELGAATPFVLVSSRVSGVDVVSTHAEINVGNAPLGMYLALWLSDERLHGVRCSYSNKGAEETDNRIVELLKTLLTK